MTDPGSKRKFFVTVVFLAVSICLILPAPSSAKEKRGAQLVINKLDGSQVRGELIAVKENSLLLLNWAGRDESVSVSDIQTIRIVRKSHTAALAIGGAAVGALGGAIYVGSVAEEKEYIPLGAAYFGTIGAVAGLALSLPMGWDTTFAIAGEPDDVVQRRLQLLARKSREPSRVVIPKPAEVRTEPAPHEKPAAPSSPSPSSHPPARRPRFKVTLAGTLSPDERHSQKQPGGQWFSFAEDAPPEDVGPHPLVYSQYFHSGMNRMGVAGPVSLSYEWTEHLSTEIEFFTMGPAPAQSDVVWLRFTSAIDGKTYSTSLYHEYWVESGSLLFGLNYRSRIPAPLERHIFEAGVAAGAGWVKSSGMAYYSFFPADRKTVLSARAQVAYDFYFIPALSLGACVGYRYLEAKFPATTISGDLEFVEEGVPSSEAERFTRSTEISLPERTFTRSTFYLSIRAGFRF